MKWLKDQPFHPFHPSRAMDEMDEMDEMVEGPTISSSSSTVGIDEWMKSLAFKLFIHIIRFIQGVGPKV